MGSAPLVGCPAALPEEWVCIELSDTFRVLVGPGANLASANLAGADLSGVNMSNAAKNSPQLGWQTEADYERLNRWGFNFVRLVLNWALVEPDLFTKTSGLVPQAPGP